jgi:hypothetical protein
LFGVTAAALIASVAFSSPVPASPVGESAAHPLVEQADLVEGAWLQFRGPSGERLVRIGEDGSATPVDLPPQLADERLRISPLQNGWTVAVDRYLPPARAGAFCCKGVEEAEPDEPGCCDDWVVAERSPRGHWIVRTLPHSRGNRTWVSEPVERHGQIELAWGEPYDGAVRVSAAPLGKPLAPPHVARHVLPHVASEAVSVSVKRGALYESAGYGPDAASSGEPEYIVERRLYGNGRFGPVHVLRSPLLYQRGTYFPLPDGSELDLYSAGDFKLLIARRAPFARGFEHPHLVLPEAEGSPEEGVAQSFSGRLLITSEAKVPPRSEHEQIEAVAVSPAGIPGPVRRIESQAGSSSRYFAGAIGGRGEWLVASSPNDGGPLWLHPSSPRCAYRQQKLQMPLATVSHEDALSVISVGRAGIFHLAWIDEHNQLQSASVRVICARR